MRMAAPDLKDESAPAEAIERARRSSVMLKAEVATSLGVRTTHRVRNLSATGAQVDQAETIQSEAGVLLCLGTLDPIPATIIWTTGTRAGLAFADPIDVDDPRIKMALKGRSSVVAPSAGWAAKMVDRYRG
jgi:hypothetical protein